MFAAQRLCLWAVLFYVVITCHQIATKRYLDSCRNGSERLFGLVISIEWGLTILKTTVHLVDVSTIDPGETVDMASIAGRYALRASNGDLPITSRREAAGVGLLLRDALGVFDDTQLACSAFGKIELADGEAPSISISHGGGVAILAVSDVARSVGGPIGADIESVDEIASVAVERMASPREWAWIDAAADSREHAFRLCQVWTRIEAILKAEGTGFSIDPRNDGLPSGWAASSVVFGRCVISCAARSTPRIVVKEHAFRVA